ncbi:UPF0702 transmembrane protein YetF [Robertmurraya siralis]|uniref:UPF0702 transmembrane protein YetF n=1 Tax=Robertmurraya siralis TaxID=77777 RepID=A0A920BVI2_9BACI|nr:DUF421 domain-containing protein [Robertmurraya siralis]PAE20697.1 hypothetical protein CHH80_10470 [Bacillus sp. 7504-2]GIN64385.1 UPF0702 transmembrane protein YetF [Robertmurraya siralis]
MDGYLQILIELIFGYIALFALTKIMGKTQITQITPFDFISALILGELVGNAIYDNDIKFQKVIYAVVIWGILIFITEILTQKKKGLRKLLEGKPSIVIRKGKIDYGMLKKAHLDINQLQHLLRSRGIFSVRECEYAILETDGSISVLRKSSYEPVTIRDLNLPRSPVKLPVTLILDGEIEADNLLFIKWNEEMLFNEMKKFGIDSEKDVLYAEWREGEELFIQTY